MDAALTPSSAWKPTPALVRHEQTAPIALPPPVGTQSIQSPADRFHCLPYRATFTAATCIKRQDLVAAPKDKRPGAAYRGGHSTHDLALCIDCEQGAIVRRRLAS